MNLTLYKLNNKDIDRAIENIGLFLQSNNVEHHEIIRTTIAAEELLLSYKERFGSDVEFSYNDVKRFGAIRVELYIYSDSFDPFTHVEDDEDNIIHRVLSNIGIDPTWVYKRNSNRILFSIKPKRKISMITQVVIALLLGILLGIVSINVPGNIASTISNDILNPVSETIMGFLITLSTFLVFFCVTNGICNIGDASSFNKIGKKTVGSFLKWYAFFGVVTLLVLIPFVDISSISGLNLDFSTIYTMLLDIIPDNILNPFITGNMLQVIFIATCTGVFLLLMGEKAEGLKKLVSEAGNLFQLLVEFVIKFMPIVVFISIYSLAINKEIKSLLVSLQIILMMVLSEAVILTISLFRVSISKKISPKILLKNMSESVMISLATSSTVASYSKTLSILKEVDFIDDKLVDVAVPLGQVIYKPDYFTYYFAVTIGMALNYDIEISIGWLITMWITSYFLAIASPPIPGSVLTSVGLLFAQLGIPMGALALVATLDPILDRIATPSLVYNLHNEMIMLADDLGMIDIKALKEDNNER